MNEPKEWRDFAEGGVLRARITGTHLVVFSEHAPPAEYELGRVSAVRSARLPGGQSTVFPEVVGARRSPGLTFEDAALANGFAVALLDAVEARV